MFRNFFRIFRNETHQNDESSSLIDAESQTSRANREILRQFSLSETEISYSKVQDLSCLPSDESLKVVDCPTFESALESFPLLVPFFSPSSSAICLHFIVEGIIGKLYETESFDFFSSLRSISGSFFIMFECKTNNSCLIYWRLVNSQKCYTVYERENSVRLSDFLKEFLIKSLKNGHNGILPQHENYPCNNLAHNVDISILADQNGLNLLVLASLQRKLELAEYLIDICGVNQIVNGKIAIDFVYEVQYFETVYLFLTKGSRYPKNFKLSATMPGELKILFEKSKKIHDAIKIKDLKEVTNCVGQSPDLRYFYNTKNESALKLALTTGAFNIYKVLMSKNCTFGPHEIFTDLLKELSDDQKEELAKINDSMLQNVGDKHILMLMSNTQVGPDDKQTRLTSVCEALQRLNRIREIKILLQIVAATRNFQLIFDFNRKHILFLQPAEEGYVTGLFDVCGRIYIGAQDLLDPSKSNEVLGVIAHEFCHYVMWIVYKNWSKPYEANDEVKRARFEQILTHGEQNSHLENIVALVFDEYEEDKHAAELIVRVPHALGCYIDQEGKIKEFKENFVGLNEFYNELISEMEEKLPEIEEEAESKIRSKNFSALNFLKYHRKKIYVTLFALIFAAFANVLIARPCLLISCGDIRAFCVVEHSRAVCKCPQNSTKSLFWEDNKCNECLNDEDCPNKEKCFRYTCRSSREVFTCQSDATKMLSNVRCDGVKDCADGSDETYHCAYGKYVKGHFYVSCTVADPVFNDDYLIFINDSVASSCERFEITNFMAFLPLNISKIYPNLKTLRVFNFAISQVTYENLWGLNKLTELKLNLNRIFFIDDAFRDLHSLVRLDLSTNQIPNVPKIWFKNLKNLEYLDLSQNYITAIEKGSFDSLVCLKNLNLGINQIKDYDLDMFDNLRNLGALTLGPNKIYKFKPNVFQNNTKLQFLNITDIAVKSLPFPLFGAQNDLKKVILYGIMDLSFVNASIFEHCVNLKELEMTQLLNINTIPSGIFKGMKKLKILMLMSNKLEEIDENLFEDLITVQWIFLSKNHLKYLPDNLFKNTLNLEMIKADGNDIGFLKSSWFRNNENLKVVDFTNNMIISIEDHFLDNLKQLSALRLSDNNCTGYDYQRIPTFDQYERERFEMDVKYRCNYTSFDSIVN